MKRHANVVLLAALVAASAGAQEVNVYGTTMAQMWKQDTPGFDKTQTFTPATQFLGIDVTKVGLDGLSVHLFGWGQVDLGDPSFGDTKNRSSLTYGYAQYRFDQANAEVKAGRFSVNQGAAIEQVDGVAARTDLQNGFAVSFFAGKPVLYGGTLNPTARGDYEFQRDVLFGGRFSWRMPKFGEIGVSYLQDGSTSVKDLQVPSGYDFTRRQLGADIRVVPVAWMDFSGRTVWDVADRPLNTTSESKIAEHDYTLALRLDPTFVITGNYAQRNFNAYYAGTNLPTLFKQQERGKFRAYGGSVMLGNPSEFLATADFRSTNRGELGEANRFGGDVRWAGMDAKLQMGAAMHRVKAFNVLRVDRMTPSYSLSHWESRAWAMYETGRYSFSLDGIHQNFDDRQNPNLNGEKVAFECVGSAGVRFTPAVKVSADLSYGTNALFKKEVRGLLRAEYRFTLGRKGGSR